MQSGNPAANVYACMHTYVYVCTRGRNRVANFYVVYVSDTSGANPRTFEYTTSVVVG
jgi:hypothetical protein